MTDARPGCHAQPLAEVLVQPLTEGRVRRLASSVVALTIMLTPLAAPSAVADINGRLTLSTAQMFRGINETQDGSAVSALLQYQADEGWYTAVWLGRADFVFSHQHSDVEVDYLAGYSHEVNARVSLDISIARYTYPTSNLNYDWTEWYGSVQLDACCTLGISVGHDWLGKDKITSAAEFTFRYPLPLGLTADATAGYQNVSNVLPRDYAYGELGLGYARQRLQLRVAWVAAGSVVRQVFGNAGNARWVAAATWMI